MKQAIGRGRMKRAIKAPFVRMDPKLAMPQANDYRSLAVASYIYPACQFPKTHRAFKQHRAVEHFTLLSARVRLLSAAA